jgi:hypothetical protein
MRVVLTINTANPPTDDHTDSKRFVSKAEISLRSEDPVSLLGERIRFPMSNRQLQNRRFQALGQKAADLVQSGKKLPVGLKIPLVAPPSSVLIEGTGIEAAKRQKRFVGNLGYNWGMDGYDPTKKQLSPPA